MIGRSVVGEVELRAELVDLVEPDQAVSIPSSWLTSARSVIVVSARSECASVRWPVLREEQVEVEVGGEALVELRRSPVEGRALGCAVVRADDRRVAARPPEPM